MQSALLQFRISINRVQDLIAVHNSLKSNARQGINSVLDEDSWLEDEIREGHSYKSFQHPDAIADAIRFVSAKKLWEEVGKNWDRPPQEVKQQLRSIVDRRNKIAHEADIDPTLSLGDRWPINEMLVTEVVDFLEQLGESIYQIL